MTMSSPSWLVNLAKSIRLRSVLPNSQYTTPHLIPQYKLTGQELQEHELPQLQSLPHLQDPAELHPQSEPGMMKVVCVLEIDLKRLKDLKLVWRLGM